MRCSLSRLLQNIGERKCVYASVITSKNNVIIKPTILQYFIGLTDIDLLYVYACKKNSLIDNTAA